MASSFQFLCVGLDLNHVEEGDWSFSQSLPSLGWAESTYFA